MLNNLPLLNVDKTAKLGSYAGFPGSGPTGQTCSRCSFQMADKSRFVCEKFRTLTGRKGKPIYPGTSACRYFEEKRAFNATPAAQ